jgi:di/tricarboxylate transporter
MIQKLIDLKDWITDRLEERTTWDGGVLVAVGLVILFLGSWRRRGAYAAIAYGLWTIWKSEW